MIELIGGGVRAPSVQAQMSDFLKKDLGMHVNGDKSMALGAAFNGANVSTAFRVFPCLIYKWRRIGCKF